MSQVGNWTVEEYIDPNDFGIQPEYSADDMNGRCIIARGVSAKEFHSPKYPNSGAKSILHNWPEEDPSTPAWGMFFSSTSVPIEKLTAIEKFPVAVRLYRKQGASYVYWDLERYTPAYNSDGKPLPPNDEKVIEAFLKERKAVV